MNSNPYTKKQRDLIKHNEDIILDNLGYGAKCLWRNEITEAEIEEYQMQAKKEQRRFKRGLRENEPIVFQRTTQLYRTIPQLKEMGEDISKMTTASDDILGEVAFV